MRKLIIIFVLVIIGSILSKGISAQLVLPTNLSLKTIPVTPTPNSTVTASALLTGSDIAGANYTWFLNNVRQSDSSGVDKNTFSFQSGKLGSVYTVTVSVTTGIGENLRDSISFTVSDADLTWSAQNQAPADYEGKILPSEGTKIIASALPIVFSPGSKTQFNPNNLTYNWFVNNTFDSKNSGLGKSAYKFTLNGSSALKVRIANSQNTAVIEKSINIRTVSPQILTFLADANGRVIYKRALDAADVGLDQKLDFIVVPYFFNLPQSQLNWSWFVDNQKMAGEPEIPWLASLQIPKDIAAPSGLQITVSVLNPYFNAENAQSLINVNIK